MVSLFPLWHVRIVLKALTWVGFDKIWVVRKSYYPGLKPQRGREGPISAWKGAVQWAIAVRTERLLASASEQWKTQTWWRIKSLVRLQRDQLQFCCHSVVTKALMWDCPSTAVSQLQNDPLCFFFFLRKLHPSNFSQDIFFCNNSGCTILSSYSHHELALKQWQQARVSRGQKPWADPDYPRPYT